MLSLLMNCLNMKFAKRQIQKYHDEPLSFKEDISLEDVAKKRFPKNVLALSQLTVTGEVSYSPENDVLFNATVKGKITVPSSRSLLPVELPLDLMINERYVEKEERLEHFEETEAVFLLENDMLDVDQSVLDNIMASLPLQILTDEEKQSDDLPAGKDWVVVSEDDFEKESSAEKDSEKLDPRLAKLDDFFKE